MEKDLFLQRAFEEHKNFVHRLVAKHVEEYEADDIVQEIFLRLVEEVKESEQHYKYIETSKGIQNLLRDLTMETLQKREPNIEIEEDMTTDEFQTEINNKEWDKIIEERKLKTGLRHLNKKYKRIFLMKYLLNMNAEDIKNTEKLKDTKQVYNMTDRAKKNLKRFITALLVTMAFASLSALAYKNIEAFRNLVDTLFRVPRTPIISNDLGDRVEFENKDKNSSFADFVFQLPENIPEGFEIDNHEHTKEEEPMHTVMYKKDNQVFMFTQSYIKEKTIISVNNMYGHLKKAKVNGNTAYYLNSPNSTILFWGDSETKTLNQLSFWFTVTRKKAIEMAESLIEE